MAQVQLTVNGRSYTVACDDGQERRLEDLAHAIDQRIEELVRSVGQIGESRLLLMAGLLVADELSDARHEVAELQRGQAEAMAIDQERLAGMIEELASRIEAIAAQLEAA